MTFDAFAGQLKCTSFSKEGSIVYPCSADGNFAGSRGA